MFALVKNRLARDGLLDYLLVIIIGLGILVISYLQSFPKLSWSDEIVYAVMGRNIAEGRGVITNFYVPASIIESGYPLGDVHVPGHMFIMAFFFWLFGSTEVVALLPNQISYFVTGLLLYWLGRQIFNRWAGLMAAVFFFLFPAMITYTHSAMAELTLILLATIYLAAWYKSLVAPNLTDSFVLALLLVAGAIHRETFLIFLPTAVYSLWQVSRPQRKKRLFFFAGTFLVLMVGVFLPLYQARAPYPHSLSDFINLPGRAEQVWFLIRNFAANLMLFLRWSKHPQTLVHFSFVLILIICGFGWSFFRGQQKRLVGFFFFAFITSFLILAALYDFVEWRGVRSFLVFVPVGVLGASGFIFQGKGLLGRYGLLLFLLVYFGYSTFYIHTRLAVHRQQTYQPQHQQSQMIIEQTQKFQPQTVMVNRAFLYGWEAYPVTVIWEVTIDPTSAKALEQAIPIDIIVVGSKDKERLADGIRQKVLKGNYQLIGENWVEEQYIFINADRLQANQ